MFGGAFLQGFGFYVIALILPFLMIIPHLKNANKTGSTGALNRLSWLFVGIFFVFPIFNAISYWIAPLKYESSAWEPLRYLLRSPISSVVGGSGLAFIILIHLNKCIKRNVWKYSYLDSYKFFSIGIALASLVLFGYVVYQHLTGFDYRETDHFLDHAKRLSSGNYRTLGFYGHPLSLASVALGMLAFYWFMVWQRTDHAIRSSWYHRRIFNGCLAICHLLILIMAGGRAPLVVGFLMLLLIPFLVSVSKKERFWRNLSVGLSGFVVLVLVYLFNLHLRFLELTSGLNSDSLDRIKFWYIHWKMFLDRPWFGHGYVWLKERIRDEYYIAYGFESLARKYNAHNFYLECLANLGVLGSLTLLTGFLVALRMVAKIIAYDEESKLLFKAWLVALVANAVHGLTQNTFFDSNLIYVYWSLLWFIIWNSKKGYLTNDKNV